MSNSVLGFLGGLSLCAALRVAGEITLLTSLQSEGAFFDVLGDHGPGAGYGVVADAQRATSIVSDPMKTSSPITV